MSQKAKGMEPGVLHAGPRIDPVQQAEVGLRSATDIAELAMELKEEAHTAEKQLAQLRTLILKASRNVGTLRTLGKYLLLLSKGLCKTCIRTLEDVQMPSTTPFCHSISKELERLLNILEEETEDNDAEFPEMTPNLFGGTFSATIDRINQLEAKCKKDSDGTFDVPRSPSSPGSSRSPKSAQSLKSLRGGANEHYPETGSGHESVIDFPQLPTVLEDIYFDPHRVRKSFSQHSGKQKHQERRLMHKVNEGTPDENEEIGDQRKLTDDDSHLSGIAEEMSSEDMDDDVDIN